MSGAKKSAAPVHWDFPLMTLPLESREELYENIFDTYKTPVNIPARDALNENPDFPIALFDDPINLKRILWASITPPACLVNTQVQEEATLVLMRRSRIWFRTSYVIPVHCLYLRGFDGGHGHRAVRRLAFETSAFSSFNFPMLRGLTWHQTWSNLRELTLQLTCRETSHTGTFSHFFTPEEFIMQYNFRQILRGYGRNFTLVLLLQATGLDLPRPRGDSYDDYEDAIETWWAPYVEALVGLAARLSGFKVKAHYYNKYTLTYLPKLPKDYEDYYWA